MGEGQLLLAAAALTALSFAVPAVAQGPLYRERWGFQLLEHRRHEVLAALRERPPEVHAEVARLLAAPENGQPFAPVAAALALVRGATLDDAFRLRAAIGAYVLPEVCDPEARNTLCRTVNVSIFVATPMPLPGVVVCDVVARDASGAERWRTTLERRDDGAEFTLEDLRMGRPSVSVPCQEWADGTYTLDVVTRIDGKLPAAGAPVLSWSFHLLRGYQARAEAAMAAATADAAKRAPFERAVVHGMAERVQRAYQGEAFPVRSEAVQELLRLERALQNLAGGKPVLAGIDGEVALGLPSGVAVPVAAVLRPARGDGQRPVVIFASGTPCYDLSPRRPSSPATRDPAWAAQALAGFAAERAWHQVFLESPGAGRDYFTAVRSVLASLPSLLPGGRGPVLLVAEREAAAVVGLQLQRLREELSGVVLVGGGVFPRPIAVATAGLPVRFARVHGTPANDAMANLIDFCAQSTEPKGLDVRWLADGEAAWPLALPLHAAAIEAFAASVFVTR
ncbi:MAG: hypothetical protein ACK501_09000 [Planctomycetota bacterium]